MTLIDQHCMNRIGTGMSGRERPPRPHSSSHVRTHSHSISLTLTRPHPVGVAVGGALGASIGAMYGTYEAIRYKVPGLYKIRYIGQTTVSSAAVFGLFLGAGSLLHCGRR